MKYVPENIDDIVAIIAVEFKTFGGGKVTKDNPVSMALQDHPAQFAAGVIVKDVVKRVIEINTSMNK